MENIPQKNSVKLFHLISRLFSLFWLTYICMYLEYDPPFLVGEEVTEFDDSEITPPEVIGSRLFLLIKSSAFSKQLKAKSKVNEGWHLEIPMVFSVFGS